MGLITPRLLDLDLDLALDLALNADLDVDAGAAELRKGRIRPVAQDWAPACFETPAAKV